MAADPLRYDLLTDLANGLGADVWLLRRPDSRSSKWCAGVKVDGNVLERDGSTPAHALKALRMDVISVIKLEAAKAAETTDRLGRCLERLQ